MTPYPWAKAPDFRAKVLNLSRLTNGWVLLVGAIAVTVLCGLSAGLVAAVVAFVVRNRFKRVGGSPWHVARGGVIVGVVIMVVMALLGGVDVAVSKLLEGMHKIDSLDLSPALPELLWNVTFGVGAGLFFGSLVGWVLAAKYNYLSEAYLEKPRQTRSMVKRSDKNRELVAEGNSAAEGVVQFGVIVDDVLPWRMHRYGMIVQRPLALLGHGMIVGAAGSGKTVASANLAYYALKARAGFFYMDLKDSRETAELMTAMAVKADARVHAFSMVARDSTAWWDPFLDDTFLPREKAAMMFGALRFEETGEAAFYGSIAQRWTALQFEVLARRGLRDGEGTFDWLARTASKDAMIAELEAYLDSRGKEQDAFYVNARAYVDSDRQIDAKLENLRTQLDTIVRFAGHLLRPNGVTEPVSFRDAERGDLVYFGLSGTADRQTMKTLGAIMLKYIEGCAAQRMANTANDGDRGNRVVVFVDEAGFLEERAGSLEALYKQAREAGYDTWTAQQSLVTYTEQTRNEIVANSTTKVVMKVQDEITAKLVSDSLGQTYYLKSRMEQTSTQNVFGERSVQSSGSAMTDIDRDYLLSPDAFVKMERHYAYIFFTLSKDLNPGRAKRDSVVLDKWAPPAPISRIGDQVPQDAPLVAIVPVERPSKDIIHEALNPTISNSFTEHISAFNAGAGDDDSFMSMVARDRETRASRGPSAAAKDVHGDVLGGGSTRELTAEELAAFTRSTANSAPPAAAIERPSDAQNQAPAGGMKKKVSAFRVEQSVKSEDPTPGASEDARTREGVSGGGATSTSQQSVDTAPFVGEEPPPFDEELPPDPAYDTHQPEHANTVPGDVGVVPAATVSGPMQSEGALPEPRFGDDVRVVDADVAVTAGGARVVRDGTPQQVASWTQPEPATEPVVRGLFDDDPDDEFEDHDTR